MGFLTVQLPLVILLGAAVASTGLSVEPPASVKWVSGAVTWTCDEVLLSPMDSLAYDDSCSSGGAIRPGVRAGGCTLSWILTDGANLYVTTAGHCGSVGTNFSVAGIGTIGTIVFKESNFDVANLRDWAFIRINPALHGSIEPTMIHYGGPYSGSRLAGFDPVRPPIPGDGVFQYGHGRGLGEEDATKARTGVVAAVLPTAFVYPGEVGEGDSGSPVRFATGEAAGITVAGAGIRSGDNRDYVPARCADIEANAPGTCAPYWDACGQVDGACDGVWRPGGIYGVVIVTRLDVAIDAFATWLGLPVRVVEGNVLGVTL